MLSLLILSLLNPDSFFDHLVYRTSVFFRVRHVTD